ncbi:hypothetical protein FOCC_FOCC010895 [Frankliniella occidentalis]|nr:hypothetical protein FOCC_FOCC010895 [Frankliniella occidentalis]
MGPRRGRQRHLGGSGPVLHRAARRAVAGAGRAGRAARHRRPPHAVLRRLGPQERHQHRRHPAQVRPPHRRRRHVPGTVHRRQPQPRPQSRARDLGGDLDSPLGVLGGSAERRRAAGLRVAAAVLASGRAGRQGQGGRPAHARLRRRQEALQAGRRRRRQAGLLSATDPTTHDYYCLSFLTLACQRYKKLRETCVSNLTKSGRNMVLPQGLIKLAEVLPLPPPSLTTNCLL